MPLSTLRRRQFLAGLTAAAVLPPMALGAAAPAADRPVARLIANENPYGPSPAALSAMRRAAARGALYPDRAQQRELVERIAEANGIDPAGVVVSSGSVEALKAACAAHGRRGRILSPGLTFDAQLSYAEELGMVVQRVPLADDLQIDLEALAAAVDDEVALVYLCNPNNPTGLSLPRAAVDRFIDRVAPGAVVLVDEAYNELADDAAGESVMDRVRAGDNVIVTRTFSKIHGLAGLRIGYAMAPPALADLIRRHVMSFPSRVAYAAALASYGDESFLRFSRGRVAEGRALVEALYRRHGVRFLPTETNFLYADIGRDADAFQAAMRAEGVLIRGTYGPYRTWSRVSMGRLEDLERFAATFERLYAGKAAS